MEVVEAWEVVELELLSSLDISSVVMELSIGVSGWSWWRTVVLGLQTGHKAGGVCVRDSLEKPEFFFGGEGGGG